MTNQEAIEALRKVSLAGLEITVQERKSESRWGDCVEVRIQFGDYHAVTELRPEQWPAEHAENLLETCETIFTAAVDRIVRNQIRAARGRKERA